MEDKIEVDDQLIADKLAEPEWPWIIALAFLAKDRAPEAIAKVIWALERYDGGRIGKIATGMALKELNHALVGDASESDWSVIKEIERPIIQAIRAGAIESFGSKKPKPDIVLKPLKRLLWAGGEIIMNETSDLKPEGERESDSPKFARQNSTRAYDVHVSASDIRELLAVPPRPQTYEHADGWTKRVLTRRQIALMEFFEICGSRWHNGEKGNETEFIAEYEKHIIGKQLGAPLKRNRFSEWRGRWNQGYRVRGRKIVHLTDFAFPISGISQ